MDEFFLIAPVTEEIKCAALNVIPFHLAYLIIQIPLICRISIYFADSGESHSMTTS